MTIQKRDHPDPLERFGHLVMTNLRDHAIDFYDRLANCGFKAPRLQRLQSDLQSFDQSQRAIARRCVVEAIDHGIHDFLFALQELADFQDDIQLIVHGQNVAKISDGLHGELFSEQGWMAKFSAYGGPDESA